MDTVEIPVEFIRVNYDSKSETANIKFKEIC